MSQLWAKLTVGEIAPQAIGPGRDVVNSTAIIVATYAGEVPPNVPSSFKVAGQDVMVHSTSAQHKAVLQ